jgi:hypothetical protein
MPTWKN